MNRSKLGFLSAERSLIPTRREFIRKAAAVTASVIPNATTVRNVAIGAAATAGVGVPLYLRSQDGEFAVFIETMQGEKKLHSVKGRQNIVEHMELPSGPGEQGGLIRRGLRALQKRAQNQGEVYCSERAKGATLQLTVGDEMLTYPRTKRYIFFRIRNLEGNQDDLANQRLIGACHQFGKNRAETELIGRDLKLSPLNWADAQMLDLARHPVRQTIAAKPAPKNVVTAPTDGIVDKGIGIVKRAWDGH
jgi:hypothetical protein